MKNGIKKLLLGNTIDAANTNRNPIEKSMENIKSIWNNDHQNDNGIEKIIRLFLASSQFLFPGIYIKQIAIKKGAGFQDLILDSYVLIKVIMPLLILINSWQSQKIVVYLLVYFLIETLLYVPTLIFASDSFSRPRSYKRSMLLLFFNYLEIVFSYAVLYSCGNYLNAKFYHWFDAIYFSIITSSSIGYGDFYPVTLYGKVLVSTQALIFLIFVVLFLNFFSTKIKHKGYFDHENDT